MRRYPDWQARLREYVAAQARAPFRYGKHDCALFAAGAVNAMTGVDLARGWRGKYRSLKRGLAMVREAGHEDHVALCASALPEIHPSKARRGDIAAVPVPDGLALGVVQGEYVWVLQPQGMASVLLTDAQRAFRV